MTSGELTALVKRPDEPHPSYHRRLSELEELTVATRIGARKCSVTGFMAEVWDVTENLPVGVIRSKSNKPSKLAFQAAFRELRCTPMTDATVRVLVWLKEKYAPHDVDSEDASPESEVP